MTILNNIVSLLAALLFCCVSISQTKYVTRSGTLGFESSMASFEPVVAQNKTVTAVLDTENGNIAILALVRGFRFPNALMEEHFNENYAETHQYPKATFSGNLAEFDKKNIQKTYEIHGKLSFHGITKPVTNVIARLEQQEGIIRLKGKFLATVADFNIEIPRLVRKKISEDIEISFDLPFKKPN